MIRGLRVWFWELRHRVHPITTGELSAFTGAVVVVAVFATVTVLHAVGALDVG